MKRARTWFGIFFCFTLACLSAYAPDQAETNRNRKRVEELIHSQKVVEPKCYSVPEGGFVYCFNPKVASWITRPLDQTVLKEIDSTLHPKLTIPLTKEGFATAAGRVKEVEKDPTHYDAVWVRDSAWHYFALKIKERKSAKTLIKSLLDFYSSNQQIDLFLSVIKNPNLANPDLNDRAEMSVPLIRFSKKTFTHYQVEDDDQEWNHIQFDSHGLFLLALADALESELITTKEMHPKYWEVIALFPAFFTETFFAKLPDAGPWEEELIFNASTAGLIASGQKRVMKVIEENSRLSHAFNHVVASLKKQPAYQKHKLFQIINRSLRKENINRLYKQGMTRVYQNLQLGGEAINLGKQSINRRADVALLFLCTLEHTPFYDNPDRIQQLLDITLSLVGPYGIYRYKYDAYQALNYWINFDVRSQIAGVRNMEYAFLTRFMKGYEPKNQPYDAQWFFDSYFSIAYYRLSQLSKDASIKEYYLKRGDYHLKRAMGQFTGQNAYAANGEPLAEWLLPESINSVQIGDRLPLAMASPISPLNWSVAAMILALDHAERAHR